MSDGPDPKRLDALEERLNAKRARDVPGPKHENHYSDAHAGWRMVTELVVGLLLGFGIGYGLDSLFGTLPIFLVIFTLIGFAGGVRAMMKSAAEIEMKKSKLPPGTVPAGKDEMYDDD